MNFAGSDTILANYSSEVRDRIELHEQCLARRIVFESGRAIGAQVVDLRTNEVIDMSADLVVAACGTVLSAQLLYASEVRPNALGRGIFEHPILFTQVALDGKLRERLASDTRFDAERRTANDDDPLRLPARDLPPNVWIPVSEKRPWHVQVTKEVVHFTPEGSGHDDRSVVDLRWYAMMEVRTENRVSFEDDAHDLFGMPQPTFDVSLSENDKTMLERMKADQAYAASGLGKMIQSQTVMPLGTCLHLQGACRMGTNSDDSVVDTNLRVWGTDNVYVVGNAVIPNTNACNPTC